MKKVFFLFIIMMVLTSCLNDNKDYIGRDIELWENTEIWSFAKCVSEGEFDKAKKMTTQDHIDVDCKEPKFGETLLSWAILNDNIEAVRFLVDHGANPNSHNTYNGESPMTDAAGGFHSIEILSYLLMHGGNPNDYVRDDEILEYKSSETPLTKAAFTSLEKTKMLVEAGGDPNFSVEAGQTPFFKAAYRVDILEYLLTNCIFDNKKTFIVTLDTGDTLYLKDLIEKDNVAYQQDSIRVKRVLEYLDKQTSNMRESNEHGGWLTAPVILQ